MANREEICQFVVCFWVFGKVANVFKMLVSQFFSLGPTSPNPSFFGVCVFLDFVFSVVFGFRVAFVLSVFVGVFLVFFLVILFCFCFVFLFCSWFVLVCYCLFLFVLFVSVGVFSCFVSVLGVFGGYAFVFCVFVGDFWVFFFGGGGPCFVLLFFFLFLSLCFENFVFLAILMFVISVLGSCFLFLFCLLLVSRCSYVVCVLFFVLKRKRLVFSEIPPVLLGIPWPAPERPLSGTNSEKRGVPSRTGGERILETLWKPQMPWIIGLGAFQPYSRGKFQETLWERFRGLSGIFPEFFRKVPAVLGVWPIFDYLHFIFLLFLFVFIGLFGYLSRTDSPKRWKFWKPQIKIMHKKDISKRAVSTVVLTNSTPFLFLGVLKLCVENTIQIVVSAPPPPIKKTKFKQNMQKQVVLRIGPSMLRNIMGQFLNYILVFLFVASFSRKKTLCFCRENEIIKNAPRPLICFVTPYYVGCTLPKALHSRIPGGINAFGHATLISMQSWKNMFWRFCHHQGVKQYDLSVLDTLTLKHSDTLSPRLSRRLTG